MEYGKLIDGVLSIAPRKVIWHGMRVYNPSQAKLIELGYKEIVYTDPGSDPPEGFHWEEHWSETDDQLIQDWILVQDETEPE